MRWQFADPHHTIIRHIATGATFPHSAHTHLRDCVGRGEAEWAWIHAGRPQPAEYVAAPEPPKAKPVRSPDDQARAVRREAGDLARNRRA